MAEEFTPRLGRPGNRGGRAAKRYVSKVKTAAKRLAKPRGKRDFTGARSGRGTAAARMAQMRGSPFAKFRMRRVIVKVHIARASKGIGKASFRAHVKYIQRDGVDRAEKEAASEKCLDTAREEDRGAGRLYDRDGEKLDDKSFLERSGGDRHQFRIIVSPEDADQLGDLRESTRAFMVEVEKDLGTKLDWVAVDHHNTGHPHTHIVIRGKDDRGRDLVIARDYLTKGMRARAQAVVMERLGPRRDMEIAQAQASEVSQQRLTGLDRRLGEIQRGNVIEIGAAKSSADRFERTLRLRRMAQLETMGLAEPITQSRWAMIEDWEDHLKTIGKRGDVIRTLSATAGRDLRDRDVAMFDASEPTQKPIIGRVISNSPVDELRDTRALGIEGVDGKVWHVPLSKQIPGAIPPIGAIVEAAPQRAQSKQSDRTIANIAAVNGGRYSAALHAVDDPGASQSFIEAHKRRLEALRRARIVTRDAHGVWTIGADYLARASRYDVGRTGGANISVKAWVDLQTQINAGAPVWLDDVAAGQLAGQGFGAEVTAARQKRMALLKREGLWSEDQGGIDPALHDRHAKQVLGNAAASETARSGRRQFDLFDGGSFTGVYERPVNLATGRFALVANAKEFAMVPWRPELERHRGVSMVIKRTRKGIEWTMGKSKGLGR